MENYRIIYHEDYLAHHGILGQKWGHRQGPPYPLDEGDHSAAERKAGWKQSVATYRTKYSEWEKSQQDADSKWKSTQEARKKLGKTGITRTINAVRNKSPEAKEYTRRWNSWNQSQEHADKLNREAEEAYKQTGKTKLGRVGNNIRYDADEKFREVSKKAGDLSNKAVKTAKEIRNDVGDDKLKDYAKKAALIAAGTATVAYMIKHPEKVEAIKSTMGKKLEKAGDALIDGMMVAAGGIAIMELTERYSPNEGDSKATRYAKEIGLGGATNAIKTATGGGFNTTSSDGTKVYNRGEKVGNELSDKLGPPSNKGVNKNGPEWNALFKDIAKSNMANEQKETVRATIKSLANAGYDMDQIQTYYNSVEHSAINSYSYRVISHIVR